MIKSKNPRVRKADVSARRNIKYDKIVGHKKRDEMRVVGRDEFHERACRDLEKKGRLINE